MTSSSSRKISRDLSQSSPTTSTVSPLCSSGRFLRAHHDEASSRDPTSDVILSPRSSSKLQRTASQSCPCTTTWIGQQRTPRRFAWTTHQKSLTRPRSFLTGNWTFVGPGSDDKWYGTLTYKHNREWNRTAGPKILVFARSGHLVLRGTSLLSRGSSKSKGQ